MIRDGNSDDGVSSGYLEVGKEGKGVWGLGEEEDSKLVLYFERGFPRQKHQSLYSKLFPILPLSTRITAKSKKHQDCFNGENIRSELLR